MSAPSAGGPSPPALARVAHLMRALDLDRPELAGVREAWRAGRGALAVEALTAHYEARRLDPRLLWEPVASAADHRRRADAALEDRFELQDLVTRAPRRRDGGLDWKHRGPKRDPEWARFLNRHDFFRSLLRAWRDTGDDRYRRCINRHLVDWIDHVPPPGRRSFGAAWRSLETARRATLPWLEIFFAREPGPVLDVLPRSRMLASLAEHGRVLRHRHARAGNHRFTELVALAVLAVAWPELREAEAWRDYALPRALRALLDQTYPDGVHTELSNHYHRVVLVEADRLLAVLALCGREAERAEVAARVRAMWDCFAGMTLPDGTGPLNNDGDREPNAFYLRDAAARFDNPEWRHVASAGAAGQAPAEPPSRFYPWAGQAVMRDGWHAGAQWARFDMGPHGSGHQHADQLSLELSIGGRHLLVDPGRYTYRPGPAREYMKGAAGHNVVRIDGRPSREPPWRVRAPLRAVALRTRRFDFFSQSARFPADPWRGRPGARWTRAVFYLRGAYWLILDRFEVCAPCEVTTSWLFHPGCEVEIRGRGALTRDPGVPNLALLPLGEVAWRTETWRGARVPRWRGWYSERYNVIAPCTQLECRVRLRRPTLAPWLLYPFAAGAPGEPPPAEVAEVAPGVVRARIGGEGAPVIFAALDGSPVAALAAGAAGDAPCVVSARETPESR